VDNAVDSGVQKALGPVETGAQPGEKGVESAVPLPSSSILTCTDASPPVVEEK
jgi:hypothetical protein